MGYIGMCSPNGYGVLDILVINRVSILVILVSNRVWFCTHVLNLLFTEEATFFVIFNNKTISKSPSQCL